MKILFATALLFGSLCLTFAQGITLSPVFPQFVSSQAEAVPTIGSDGIHDTGVFSIRFNITSLSGDVYLDRPSAFSSLSPVPASGFIWSLHPGSSGSVMNSASAVYALSSNIAVTPEFFRISEGDTGVFDLLAYVTPGTTGFYGVTLVSFTWTASPSNPIREYRDLGGPLGSYFNTDVIVLQAVPEPSMLALGALGMGFLFLLKRKRS